MSKITLLQVFLTVSLGFDSSGAVSDLPPYVSRCSLKEPELDKCLVEKSNEAIPILVKGDSRYNIPPTSPIVYAEALLYGDGLKYKLFDTYSDDWKNTKVTDMHMDLENGQAFFTAVLDRLELTAQNYTIMEGKIVDIPATGHGKHNTTLVGVKLSYRAGLRINEKGGEAYLENYEFATELSVTRGYFYFENIHSLENSDVNAHIEENWEQFFKQVKPAFESYFNSFISYPVQAITNAVPFNKLFIP